MNEDAEARKVQWAAKGLTTRLVAEIEIDSTPQVLSSWASSLRTAHKELSPVAGVSKQVKWTGLHPLLKTHCFRVEGDTKLCTYLLLKETVSLFFSLIDPYKTVLHNQSPQFVRHRFKR